MFACKLDEFSVLDLERQHQFEEFGPGELQRHLSSNFRNAALVYGRAGSVQAIWSNDQSGPYHVSVARPGMYLGSGYKFDLAADALRFADSC